MALARKTREQSYEEEEALSHELSHLSSEALNSSSHLSTSSSNVYQYAAFPTNDSSGRHLSHLSTDCVDIHEGITLTWERISCYAHEFTKGFLGKDVKIGSKTLLHGVSGIAQPGQLVAIVGASGAGKTTLLNILTCRNLTNLTADGIIKANGVVMGSNIKRISAYVQQSDIFVGCLTVEEHLWYNAVLRMGDTYSRPAKKNRVHQLLYESGLQRVAQVSTNPTKGGLSGSEKKMLSISSEILVDPPVLFCDEPTTGLDSTMAETVVSMLQMMARKGKTILCTIHQPASHIFDKFDQIILLGEGRVGFQGTRQQALDFFFDIGFPCPSNYNVADHLIQTLAIRPGMEKDCLAKVKYISRKYQDTTEYQGIQRKIQAINQLEGNPQFHEVMRLTKQSKLYKASWWNQLKILTWKMTLDQVRDPSILFARIIQNIIAVFTLSLLYFQVSYDQKGVLNMNGSMFQLISHFTYIALIDLASFCNTVPMYFREYRNGMYRPDTFFFAKNLSDIPIFVILLGMTVAVTYWSVGYYSSFSAFGVFTLVLLLVYQYSVSLNVYFLGVICDQIDLALNIAPPLRICFMLLGGYLANDATLPVYIGWLKYISWYRSGYELIAINQWSRVDEIACEDGLEYSSCYHSGNDVLEFLNFKHSNITFDYVMLISLGLLFRFLALVILAVRSREITVNKN